ncbi:MAG TPA: heavy metal-associated domain-containing protein [Terriglobia bacterium]|nr:heavy metal-associated domain-containing protein [Terriglobia bacterium]
MKKTSLLVVGAILGSAISLQAQVERVAMRTTGISCGMCAAVSEVYLRQLGGVDKIKISLSQEAIMVLYKPGAAFRPKDIRDALKKTDVGVTQFQISARGQVQQQNGKRLFIAGKDVFILVPSTGLSVPADTPVVLEGILNDQTSPMELKVLSVNPIAKK